VRLGLAGPPCGAYAVCSGRARGMLHVAAAFARRAASIAIEASVALGWPIGWALAAHRWSERGKRSALQYVERTPRHGERLALQGAELASLVVPPVWSGARRRTNRGVVEQLLEEGASPARRLRPVVVRSTFSGKRGSASRRASAHRRARARKRSGVLVSASARGCRKTVRQVELEDATSSRFAARDLDTLGEWCTSGNARDCAGLPPWAQSSSLSRDVCARRSIEASGILAE